MKKPSNPANQETKELGNLFQTIRKARMQGRGGPISPEAVQSIGRLFDTVKKAAKKRKISLDYQ